MGAQQHGSADSPAITISQCPACQGPDNRHSADTIFNIGVTAQLSGDRRSALAHFRKALHAYKRHLASDHPAIARVKQRIEALE